MILFYTIIMFLYQLLTTTSQLSCFNIMCALTHTYKTLNFVKHTLYYIFKLCTSQYAVFIIIYSLFLHIFSSFRQYAYQYLSFSTTFIILFLTGIHSIREFWRTLFMTVPDALLVHYIFSHLFKFLVIFVISPAGDVGNQTAHQTNVTSSGHTLRPCPRRDPHTRPKESVVK